MAQENRLYGHKIIPSLKASIAEQIHYILCEEIHAGRWKVGELLPSLSTLLEMTGLGRRGIQRALEMLEEEGYVRKEERRGTFLAAVLPEGRSPRGVIGIVIPAYSELVSPATAAWGVGRLHLIQKAAVARNFTTEVFCLEEGDDGANIDSTRGHFGDRVKGVISLCAFRRPNPKRLPPDRIPIVFAGLEDETCEPCVWGDSCDANTRLARRVIEMGHRSIVFCGSPMISRHDIDLRFRGFARAMNESGLPVREDALERSLTMVVGDRRAHREFLEAGGADVTAVVCATCQRAQDVIAAADEMGLRIPEDLSVVAHGPATDMRPEDPGPRIASIGFDGEYLIGTCFDLLLEQVKTRQCPLRRVIVNPFFEEGESLVAPRRQAPQKDVELASFVRA